MTDEIVAVRSVEVVTAEIITIREHTKKVFFDAVVQIGRRLEEAKQLVPEGGWLEYLEHKLGYKPSTAQNYMRIAREFGGDQLDLSGKTAGDVFGELGYSQLLPLLGMSEEEREELAQEHDLEGMSSREIAALVKERDEAKQKAEEANRLLDKQQKGLIDAKARANDLKIALEHEKNAAAAAKEAEHAAAEQLRKELTELTAKASASTEPDEAAIARLREEIAAEQAEAIKAAEARAAEAAAKLEKVKNPTAHKVNFLFLELQSNYMRLMTAIGELEAQDGETGAKMRGVILGQIGKWAEL